jgi:mono/diheme cytochrome c family protein
VCGSIRPGVPLRLFKTFTAAPLATLALFVVAGCGGGSDAAGGAGASSNHVAGARVFADAGCGSCHTLAAAGSKGTTGPDLDRLKPSRGSVLRQVERGGIGMPSFSGKLTQTEIRAVAAFVSESASGSAQAAADFEPDDTELSSCKGEFACLEQAFGNLAYESGPQPALAAFDQRIASDREVEANCHRIAHTIGAASLAHFDGSVGKAFAGGSASCWSGYYHGVLERAFSGVPESRVSAVARKLCVDAEIRRVTFVAYQCVHGLGHGLMLYTDYDLPRSLRICDALDGSWDQVSCTGGVFMENISSSYGVKSRWLKDDDLIYPCNAVKERHKVYCYLMVTSRILPVVGYDFGRTAAFCRRSEPGWVATCYQSLGRDASGQTRQDPARIAEICRLARGGEGDCLYGAARDITSNYADPRRAGELCRDAPARYRQRCFLGIGTIVGSLETTDAGRRAACRKVGARYASVCARGAGA